MSKCLRSAARESNVSLHVEHDSALPATVGPAARAGAAGNGDTAAAARAGCCPKSIFSPKKCTRCAMLSSGFGSRAKDNRTNSGPSQVVSLRSGAEPVRSGAEVIGFPIADTVRISTRQIALARTSSAYTIQMRGGYGFERASGRL